MTNTHIITELIAEIVENYPQSIALDGGHRQLRYEELDRSADRFAAYLVKVGVVPGDTVAICMERSFEWIVAALGIRQERSSALLAETRQKKEHLALVWCDLIGRKYVGLDDDFSSTAATLGYFQFSSVVLLPSSTSTLRLTNWFAIQP